MKILTFNHHESYLCSLAALGYEFDVITAKGSLDLSWNKRARSVPANFNLVDFDEQTRKKLKTGQYDAVICHTVKNLLWVWSYRKPRYVFIAHIPIFKTSITGRVKGLFKKFIWRAFKLTHNATFFAVSHFKRDAWNEPGEVAVLTPEHFPPLKPLTAPSRIAIVCNDLLKRGEELGLDMIRRLRQDLPIQTIGRNEGVDFNILPRDFADFQDLVTGFHIYLYTIKMPWGDGYNTAMLEAMRMGMAIVTVENPTSPIEHGVNGLIGKTEDELRQHLIQLRADPELVNKLGAAAQKTVEENFSKEKFMAAWRRALGN